MTDPGIATLLGRGLTAGQQAALLVDRSGASVVMDFFFKAILDGKGFQVRAGTVTTPLVGDVAITDTAAEFAVDCTAGQVVATPAVLKAVMRLMVIYLRLP